MPRFIRTFNCIACRVDGRLDKQSEGFVIIECPKCLTAEVWDETPELYEMQSFVMEDFPIPKALAG